jgi:hypothetical protein
MNISDAKRIDLVAFMRGLGHTPTYCSNGYVWFLSPFRQEKKASFRINTSRNLWYDYGLGDGGDIILLCRYMYHVNSVSEALKMIAQLSTTPADARVAVPVFDNRGEPPDSSFKEIKIKELHNSELLRYLTSRGIIPDIATSYCQEIHYTLKRSHYYGIAFCNISGGHEVRNRYFKGCIGSKDLSIIRSDADSNICCVFEGFIDFLSWLTMKEADPHWSNVAKEPDFVVLNSVANRRKAAEFLTRYAKIYCYMDNDESGKMTTSFLNEALHDKVIDCSEKYKGFKDLNDFWCQTIAK